VLDPLYGAVINRPTTDITNPEYSTTPSLGLPDTAPSPVHSPVWWRDRLLAKLVTRAAECQEYDDFYEGRQPLAMASVKFQEVFGSRYARLPANFMPLVVGAEAERLIVQGFRFGTSVDGDKTAWGVWQANEMDAESQIAHEITLVKGVSYAAVDPMSPTAAPNISIEDPSEVIVETRPGNRRDRLAGLKVWTDDDGYIRAYLYLPTEIWRWRSEKPRQSDGMSQVRWIPYADPGEDQVLTNRLGVVPIIPLLNRPRRSGVGRSEIIPVMGNQNAINKLRFDALIASEFVAFPQRWATNIEVPVDPDTGKPIQPFKPGVDNLWVVRRPTPAESMEYGDKVPSPQMGQFPAADLAPYINMIEEEVGQMASISRTPYHYLLGSPTSVPPSGESLKSSEAALVRKVGREQVHLGEGWEEVIRVCFIAMGQTTKARTDGETIWEDTETRNEAARGDTVLKQYAAGLLPDAMALEMLGYSQQQIERIAVMKANEPQPAPPPERTLTVQTPSGETKIRSNAPA
jgi:hypothetical protein